MRPIIGGAANSYARATSGRTAAAPLALPHIDPWDFPSRSFWRHR
jgi:hypothetical protein